MRCYLSRSHLKCTKHVAAPKRCKNKLAILNVASFCVSISPGLPSQTFKHKLVSEVKISSKQTPSRKPCFSKPKCCQFLYKTSTLYILSDSCTSENMLGTKNVWYGGIFKASKKILLNHTYFEDCRSQKSVATILVTYVTALTEPDFAIQNSIRASQCDFGSMF